MFGLILKYHRLVASRYFKSRRAAKLITVFLFLLVIAVVVAGLFIFFERGFSYITKDVFFSDALVLYSYEFFLLAVAYLILASGFITGIFGLFKSRNDDWLMVSPRFRFAPFYYFLRNFISSLWPLIIMVLPALFAVRHALGLSAAGLPNLLKY